MTSTLSAEIKRKLTEKNFNNRYKMLTKLSHLLQSDEDAQFMHLTQCIDSTNVQMNNNKQTLLCLSMSLSVSKSNGNATRREAKVEE